MSASLYLHIPFCRHRCAYCDFNTYAGLDSLMEEYVAALRAEARFSARAVGEKAAAHTVFFGGGTPSLLPVGDIGQILEELAAGFDLAEEAEISLEANPGTVSLESLRRLRAAGVNRLSLGMQSGNADELRLLEREHTYEDVVQAVSRARQAGFDNLNLDLIYGLPDQAMDAWQRTVRLALDLEVEHLSLYALTLEHGTPMARWAERGLMSEPDPDRAADMYEWACEALEAAGYWQYEISNWARGKERQCRHNLQYWRCLPYLGFGAGAHGYARGVRTANILSPAGYIQRMQAASEPGEWPHTAATASVEIIGREEEMGEVMMMGLRLTEEGVHRGGFQERFGRELESVYGAQIEQLAGWGLLEWAGETLRLTQRGRLLGNRVFREFLGG
ncbi:MAG: radical SAM family heme chaperone HemW [Chloroflexi bacterium]|nr:radical SAM family heme chaperone HemW [Chloroflexota bacterium]